MTTHERLIADAARRATLLWLAEMRLRNALSYGGEKKVLKEAARLQTVVRSAVASQEAWR